ncbi:MAG: GrdX family protein [Defluviitaleaceae bacterium]|nr:GrdX family protein [Defluviitaleaceae bacterium]
MIITNNPMVNNACHINGLIFIDGSLLDVLTAVRDYVHRGYTLQTHPLSGSVKPGETPYKTVVLESGESVCFKSLNIIEESILTARKLTADRNYTDKMLKDFQLIDHTLIFERKN